MEHCESEAVIAFDTLYTNNHIQILKVLLPYIDMENRKSLAVMIKYLELQYTMDYFNRHPADLGAASYEAKGTNGKTPDIVEIFSEIKNFCTPSERAMFEQLANMKKNMEMFEDMMNMMKLFQEMMPDSGGTDNGSSNFSGFGGMGFPPGGMNGFGGFPPGGGSQDGGQEGNNAPFGNPLDMLKGMLSPEQQSMFEMFQSSFGDK